MLILLSPAKKLDFESNYPSTAVSQAHFLDRSADLIKVLRTYAPQQLAELMGISDELAVLNMERFALWQTPFNLDNAKPAMFAFNGDVYHGLNAVSLAPATLAYAQEHLRILSGLYGLLRPLDLIQAYRLEMGTKLTTTRGKNLYEFWGSIITQQLASDLKDLAAEPLLLNLASSEYTKAVQFKHLNCTLITPTFKDWSKGQYKIISFFAKQARGLMARFILEQRGTCLEQVLDFAEAGYTYNAKLTKSIYEPVFTRQLIE